MWYKFQRKLIICSLPPSTNQLRTRDCRDCTFYLFSLTEPVIELSRDIRFAPFNGAYSEVRARFLRLLLSLCFPVEDVALF